MAYVPTIGVAGLYQLRAPFDSQVLDGVQYTCTGVRSIQDLSANGESAFDSVYVPYNLSQDAFNADVTAGASIVTLQAAQGNRIVVPSTYIVGMPDLSGVPYIGTILSMDLALLPTSLNLDYLKERLAAVVLATIGVQSTVDTIVSSVPKVMTDDQHKTIEAARDLLITESESDYSKVVALTTQRDQLLQQNKLMADWIKNNQPK